MDSSCTSLVPNMLAYVNQAIRSEFHYQWRTFRQNFPGCSGRVQGCCIWSGCLVEDELDGLGDPYDSDGDDGNEADGLVHPYSYDDDNDSNDGWELQDLQPKVADQVGMLMPVSAPSDATSDTTSDTTYYTAIESPHDDLDPCRSPAPSVIRNEDENQVPCSPLRPTKRKFAKQSASKTRSDSTRSVKRKRATEPKLQRSAALNWFRKNYGHALPNRNGRVYNVLEAREPKRHFTHLAVPNGKKGFARLETAIIIGIASATSAIPSNHIYQESGRESSATAAWGSMAMFVGEGSKFNVSAVSKSPLDSSATQDELELSFELLTCLGVLHQASEIKENFERRSDGVKLACIVIKSSSERCVSTMTDWLAYADQESWLKEDGTLLWPHNAFKELQKYIVDLRAEGILVYFCHVSERRNMTALSWAESGLQKHYDQLDLEVGGIPSS